MRGGSAGPRFVRIGSGPPTPMAPRMEYGDEPADSLDPKFKDLVGPVQIGVWIGLGRVVDLHGEGSSIGEARVVESEAGQRCTTALWPRLGSSVGNGLTDRAIFLVGHRNRRRFERCRRWAARGGDSNGHWRRGDRRVRGWLGLDGGRRGRGRCSTDRHSRSRRFSGRFDHRAGPSNPRQARRNESEHGERGKLTRVGRQHVVPDMQKPASDLCHSASERVLFAAQFGDEVFAHCLRAYRSAKPANPMGPQVAESEPLPLSLASSASTPVHRSGASSFSRGCSPGDSPIPSTDAARRPRF
jgi:hypothetical protein